MVVILDSFNRVKICGSLLLYFSSSLVNFFFILFHIPLNGFKRYIFSLFQLVIKCQTVQVVQKMLGSQLQQFSYQMETISVLSQRKSNKKDNLRSCCDKIAVFVDSYKKKFN
jgi:hypothetical protein